MQEKMEIIEEKTQQNTICIFTVF